MPQSIRLNSTHYFIMKISNKHELQQIALNHSSDIDRKGFMNLYKKCTTKPYYKECKNYSMILTEKQQKYQHYHLENVINMNILQVKKYYFIIKLVYSPLGKTLD